MEVVRMVRIPAASYGLFGLLWLGLSAAGPVVSAAETQAQAYFQQVVDANLALKQAGFQAGRQLGTLFADREPDGPSLQQAVENAKTTYTRVANQMRQATPPDSPEGQALSRSHQRFLEGQRTIIQEEFTGLMQMALDTRTPLAERKAALQQGLQAIAEVEQKSLPPLVDAFMAYAKRYNISLE